MAKKYQLTYYDVDETPHLLEIYDDSFGGVYQEDLVGRVYMSGSVDDVFDPIQGTSLRVDLEATAARDFSDLGLASERQFRCVYSIDGFVKFRGWLNPEGWWESLNSDTWTVSFDVIDGLGYLEGLSYVQSNGLYWTGKQSALDIIINTLSRAGLNMDVRMGVNMMYTGYVTNANIMSAAYFNAERFYQDDDEPMSCYDVLKSTLEVFGCAIRQKEGEWYIFRPNQLAVSPIGGFWHYNYQGVAQSPQTPTVDLTQSIASEGVAGSGLRYVNRNQRLSTLRALGGFSVNYKYGPATSLIGANKYLYTADGSTYNDWTINSTTNMTIPGAGGYGVTLACVAFSAGILQMTSSGTITIAQNDLLELTMSARQSTYPFTNQHSLYYRVILVVGGTTYYLLKNGSWTTTASSINETFTGVELKTWTVSSQVAPGAGNVTIEIYTPEGTPASGSLQILSIELTNVTDGTEIEGETHTAQRTSSPTSKIEDPEDVFVGDTPTDSYVGAIYKADTTTNTDEWTRYKVAETKPILQIMCEDRLRMAQDTRYVFSGDIKGYFDFLSVFTLEGVSGVFLPVKYDYSSMQNVTNVTMHQILDDELADLDYSKVIDYGEAIKPKIKG